MPRVFECIGIAVALLCCVVGIGKVIILIIKGCHAK